MLGGNDPVVIFQFSKALPSLGQALGRIPIISKIPTVIDMPPVPIYLSEDRTGLCIDSESKDVTISTSVQTMTDGSAPAVDQKGVGSSVTIVFEAKKDAVGVSLLSAMIDQVFDKLSSKEYSISYLHGATTIFRGIMQSYQVSQTANTDKINITIEISRGEKQPQKQGTPAVENRQDGVNLINRIP